jgi:tight adherence protein C
MPVCVEAGLAMDAVLARVGAEIGLKSPVLAEALQLVTLEMRAGSGKEKGCATWRCALVSRTSMRWPRC